jgi:hypothetical protein
VYYELLGELQLSELLKHVSLDRLVKLHVLAWERTRNEIFPACSKRIGREVFTCTCVLDLKGVRINSFTKDVREFISRIATIDQVRKSLHIVLMHEQLLLNSGSRTLWLGRVR